jgi:hypothetical protein
MLLDELHTKGDAQQERLLARLALETRTTAQSADAARADLERRHAGHRRVSGFAWFVFFVCVSASCLPPFLSPAPPH